MDHFGESLEKSDTVRNVDSGCLAHERSEGEKFIMNWAQGHSCDILRFCLLTRVGLEKQL